MVVLAVLAAEVATTVMMAGAPLSGAVPAVAAAALVLALVLVLEVAVVPVAVAVTAMAPPSRRQATGSCQRPIFR